MSIINKDLDMSNPTSCGVGPTKDSNYGEIFEIHITGDEKIHEAAKELGLKTIKVELLRPDKSVIRTEHMTSIVKKFDYFEAAYHWTMRTATELQNHCEIKRVKIESLPYPHYLFLAKYVEVHFKDSSFKYATSKNPNKNYFLGTERVPVSHIDYLENKYPNEDIEICLYDNNIEEDKDWFELWK